MVTVVSVALCAVPQTYADGPGGSDAPGSGGDSSSDVEQGTAAVTLTEDTTVTGETYTSEESDENALRIDGATVVLDSIVVNKSGGATSDAETGDFYGMNAALLATNGADVTIRNSTVTSSVQGGNGIFSYGESTVVTVSDTVISTTADNSGGIQTTGGGTTYANNLTITTEGSSAAAIRSDRGGGTVVVDKGSYTSSGYNSPAVYSTADITVSNAELTAVNSEALVVEGENSITLDGCTVYGNMSDDKGTSSDENVHNVMIYQSQSGDADDGTSTFSMTGGSLTSNNGDVFYVTNTSAEITLSDVKITNNDDETNLFTISGNSGSHGWGDAGSNGADVVLTLDSQSLDGDIEVDEISTLSMILENGTEFTGTVNIVENDDAQSSADNNAVITISEDSVWSLTGDCFVTSVTNNGTIDYNGYIITLADGTELSDSSDGSSAGTDSDTEDDSALAFDSSAWLYNSSYDVYYQTGVVYCTDPYDTTYESFGIYVPADYMNMTSNGDNTYSFISFSDTVVGNYTAETAPIVIPVNTSGYSAQAAPTGFSSGVTAYTDEGIIYLYAGCRGRDTTNGGAPWGVTDLKAAIRYYRYNSGVLPGNTDSIFTFGHSGGGAQSAVVGASGDSELYYPYLYSIGAAGIEYDEGTGTYTDTLSDAVCGSMCWCPITNLDYADEAYEWMMGQYSSSGTRADGEWTSLLSDDMSEAFAEYINGLTLEDEDGNALTLTDDGDGIYTSGSYYDYILYRIEYSLNDFIDSYTDEDGSFSYSGSSSSSGGDSGPGGDSGGPGGDSSGPGGSGGGISVSAVSYDSISDYLLSIDENYGSDGAWIVYDSDNDWYSISSIEDFVLYGSKEASKDVGAFDDLNRSQAENYVFGTGSNGAAHFDSVMAELMSANSTEYAEADSSVSESDIASYAEEYTDDYESYTSDALLGYDSQYRQNMYNPMYYLCGEYDGYETSTAADHWRISTGITQSDTSVTVETNLYLALLENISDGNVKDVDFAMHWAQGHTEAERAGADNDECFIAWVVECVEVDIADNTTEITDVSIGTGSGVLKVTVEAKNPNNGVIIAAGYKDDELVDFAVAEDTTAELSDECETIKIFIWDSLSSMKPLCTAQICYVE